MKETILFSENTVPGKDPEITMLEFFWSRTASVWLAVLYMLLGILLLVFPAAGGTAFVWALAAGAAVYAVSHLWRFFHCRRKGTASGGDLFLGILPLAFGVFALTSPAVILAFLPLVLGLLLLADGIGKLPLTYQAMKNRSSARVSLLFAALIPIVLGVILVLNPFRTYGIVVMVFGITLLADGLSDLFTVLTVRRKRQED